MLYINTSFYIIADVAQALGGSGRSDSGVPAKDPRDDRTDPEEEHANIESDQPVEDDVVPDFTNLTGKQKKLFELRLKMVRLNQLSMYIISLSES